VIVGERESRVYVFQCFECFEVASGLNGQIVVDGFIQQGGAIAPFGCGEGVASLSTWVRKLTVCSDMIRVLHVTQCATLRQLQSGAALQLPVWT
jgi:hypothetical protein